MLKLFYLKSESRNPDISIQESINSLKVIPEARGSLQMNFQGLNDSNIIQ